MTFLKLRKRDLTGFTRQICVRVCVCVFVCNKEALGFHAHTFTPYNHIYNLETALVSI